MALTLNELIERLKILQERGYGELPTQTDGCDCIGPCSGVTYESHHHTYENGYILLEREQ